MEKIPTALEYIEIHNKEHDTQYSVYDVNTEFMILFAKLHVKAALEAAYTNAKYEHNTKGIGSIGVTKESILNAYPLTNIK